MAASQEMVVHQGHRTDSIVVLQWEECQDIHDLDTHGIHGGPIQQHLHGGMILEHLRGGEDPGHIDQDMLIRSLVRHLDGNIQAQGRDQDQVQDQVQDFHDLDQGHQVLQGQSVVQGVYALRIGLGTQNGLLAKEEDAVNNVETLEDGREPAGSMDAQSRWEMHIEFHQRWQNQTDV